MWKQPKGEYYAYDEDDLSSTICWDDLGVYWMFIKGEQVPGTFPDKESAKEYYEQEMNNGQ